MPATALEVGNMAEEDGLGANRNMHNAAATSSSLALETETEAGTSSAKNDTDKSKDAGTTQTIPLYKLFSFADSVDVVLMIVGTIGAVGNGLCLPLMTVLFGELTDSFGQNQNTPDVVRVVSKVIKTSLLSQTFLHFVWLERCVIDITVFLCCIFKGTYLYLVQVHICKEI